jgi:thymidylate synthase
MNSEWMAIVKHLLDRPTGTSRDGDAQEILGYQMTLRELDTNFLDNDIRNLSPVYASAELLWYLSGTKNIEMIKAYAPQYERFAENGEAHGAYGYRWMMNGAGNQFTNLIDLLNTKEDTRQAVISMWEPDDLKHAVSGEHKDLPCTLSLQFLIRDEKLHLITTMRSNDVWLGLPYDVYCFTSLQRILAGILCLEEGNYIHQAGSEHLYDRNRERAQLAIKTPKLSHRNNCQFKRGTNVITGFLQQAQTAVALEKEVRENKQLDFDLLNRLGSSILRDSVLMCASKWYPIVSSQFTSRLFGDLHWKSEKRQ